MFSVIIATFVRGIELLYMAPAFSILVIILFVGLFIFGVWYNSPKQKGKRGENWVHDLLMQLPEEYHVLDDVVLNTESGTTQIDHIVVSKYGIFAIETKNYRGEIYGDDNRQQWTQIIVTEVRYRRKWYKTYTYVTKNHFYNPVKQSHGHIFRIKKTLSKWSQIKYIPIVVFTGSADISNVKSNNHVICDYNLIATILNYQTTYLSDNDVQNVIKCLSEKNVREEVDNKVHVHHVKTVKNELDRKLASGICPKCGGKLVQRNGRYGSFYGCSNYPKCRFTTNL